MNTRKVCSFFLLILSGLAGVAVADEPLAVKVELQHGRLGTAKEPVAVSGEYLCFNVAVEGLKTREQGEVELDVQAELRNENNDLIQIIGNQQYDLKRYLGKGKYRTVVVTQIPVNHEEGKLKLVLQVRDVQADQEVKSEFSVAVKKPTGVYLANVALARAKSEPSSGRFDIGEVVFVPFRLLGTESAKKANCVLALIPSGKSESILDLQSPIRFVEGIRPGMEFSGGFQFPAMESFEGVVRLTVIDDASNQHSVELPLHIMEPLRSESVISVGGVGTAPASRLAVPLFKPDERICRIRLSHENSSDWLSQANEASCSRAEVPVARVARTRFGSWADESSVDFDAASGG